MESLESEYRKPGRVVPAFFFSGLVTFGLFLAIPSTLISLKFSRPAEQETAPLYYVPPPAPPTEVVAPQPQASKAAQSYSIDFSMSEKPAELSLDFLDVPIGHNIDSAVPLSLDAGRKFVASKPDLGNLDGFVVYERSEVDEIPYITFAPEPRVPYDMQRVGAELIVLYRVNAKGRAENVHVLDTSDERFNRLAKDAISHWRFKPAIKSGKAVDSWVQHIFSFQKGSGSPFSLD